MSLVNLLQLLISVFGVLTFSSLTALVLRDQRDDTVGVVRREEGRKPGTASLVISAYTIPWFLVAAGLSFVELLDESTVMTLQFLSWSMSFVYPPLIMHIQYDEIGWKLERNRIWRNICIVTYFLSCALGLFPLLFLLRVIGQPFMLPVILGMCLMFVSAAVYSVLMMLKGKKDKPSTGEKKTFFWHLLFWLFVVIIFPVLILAGGSGLVGLLGLVTRSLPLMFVFVSFYYLERFTFFDVFVKRGLFAIMVLVLLASYFRLASFLPERFGLLGGETWLYALTLLPIALTLPWAYRKIEKWLDRVWLERRFTPVEAVKFFVSGLENATDESILLSQAEARLVAIFQAPAQVATKTRPPTETEIKGGVELPLKLSGNNQGLIRIGRRRNAAPFFSKDISLLTSLADILAHLVENVRLQNRKQEDEKRQKELEIHASRSELKALRAQINPHFLFNALNAIAGLIPSNPDLAEETVEQLAEVFRYTLRDAEKEWARLSDELDFVQAYLDVEKARFGDRLQVEIKAAGEVSDLRFPVMMIQTLVENAVKHGVASVRGTGRILVTVSKSDSDLVLQVCDNGPGLDDWDGPAEGAFKREGSGYGLRNVEERLQGYFAGAAKFELSRDETEQLTKAVIRVPISEVSSGRRDSL
jgi:signal transduction histidine kinase